MVAEDNGPEHEEPAQGMSAELSATRCGDMQTKCR